jgi:pSer/pThr/pTyr-binding forkhead associated (FHA) protein
MYGELVPLGGGDSIPLMKQDLIVGRRESCDIVLRFSNVSGQHCQLQVQAGYWFVTDKNSRNGVKVNDNRVTEKRLDPNDVLTIAKHKYRVVYSPQDLGATGPPPGDEYENQIFEKSLLERAGLQKLFQRPSKKGRAKGRTQETAKRYDPLKDSGGRFRDPDKPL